MAAHRTPFAIEPLFPQAKCAISIRLDEDVLAWFRLQGKGYQTLINGVLRGFVESKTKRKQAARSSRMALAQRLYREFHDRCFWHLRPDLEINASNIRLVVDGLRRHGGREGWLKAEELCR